VKVEILYGFHPVYEALRAGRRTFYEIYVSKHTPTKRIEQITSEANHRQLPISIIGPAKLETMAGTESHQGFAAKVSAYPLTDAADFLTTVLSGDRPPLLLLLDHIVDPHNLGAIIRTALCAGVNGIIIPKDRAAHPTAAVSRISTGALEHSYVAQVNNLVRFIKTLKKKGMWIVGLDQKAGQSIYRTDFNDAIGIVIGGEEKGLRPLVKNNCDFLVAIPQSGPLGSLNASVAGAIVMYETYRQRHAS
jgi:23S rRNA (guanosine2251-2'-O)-methyltransferase